MTIKAIARKRSLTTFNSDKFKKEVFPVQIYVNDRKKVSYIGTDFVTTDINFSGVFNDKDRTREENRLLSDNLCQLMRDMEDFYDKHVKELDIPTMKAALQDMVKGVDLSKYVKGGKTLADWVDYLAETKDRDRTKVMWHGTAKKVREFDERATFESVDLDWIERFDKWMRVEGRLATNTRSIQMRNLRAAMNWAVDEDKIAKNPFKKFKIKEELVEPLVLTLQQVADFRDYPVEEWQEVYRDITMLSFYLGGVNIGDLALAKGLRNGRFVFDRQKTGVRVNLPVCEEAMAIIEKYSGDGEYMLSILDHVSDYNTFDQHLNIALKKIGWSRIVKDKVGRRRKIEYHGMLPDVTMYTFRYSFATIAANLDGVTIEDIGRCLGHAWALRGNVTAERYIITTTQKVDKTFRNVMDALRAIKGRPKEVIDAEIKRRDGIKDDGKPCACVRMVG